MPNIRLTRRETVLALLSSAAAGVSLPAFAQQAEWRQSYDAGSRNAVQRSSTPMLSPAALAATEQAVEAYRALAARGGWPTLQVSERLSVGSRGPSVVALRQRLIITGDLDASAGDSNIYDSYVEGGMRRFQSRMGLSTTGSINRATLAALNVPVDRRIRQLETNIVRLRTWSGSLGNRYVVANIPAAAVETVENGHVATRHAAGVGKIDRQSPLLQTKIPEVNFNPTWTVPASIIRKDLIPKMQKEPTYLTENKIRIIGPSGEIPPDRVNWRSDEATRYTFRQDPGGEFNSLGFVRINIPSPHGVYMHDTPSKGIFGDDYRFVSSGCIRVQNVRDYIAFLLKETPGWDRAKIDETIASGERVNARIANPVPCYWVYITAWATPDGGVQFRDDIYNKDGLGPAAVAALQGDQDI
ncbi:Murein L,D-transpeptidase YcbB/YkuD [Bosea sp. 62]|uniref:L,D-transpeptidase family protein n=1 Tax=unclassified Bosea (in: a-proteobacteria) TaxID=2653178 RepID=UPI001251724A|nr:MULTISPECIES: L,D-transpeptidase family protein [unclassified Bosea (in: a-proteobacteria)]CAD5254527.1 Murein L,D-transpeptidase YcbB/YkuD [Bosea sp. 21B]CAD5285983.1 Murein L,D-transpeptidase YcbB/YkuD [Bosea sp. 7B]CAD5301418.1 Murein L,D-transpeptidase YcbB/YkuD [Bosea sp. 46]VVT57524.1 Murein L,D-transpeptidase YcbB/YkuD [Bosea sp. EC-HK365B]VXB69976.1 Murein L,D-transpeptidase YcbB/YkuD [Bosea sp. 125]